MKNVFMTYLPETISNGIVSVKKEYAEYEGGEYAGNVDDKIWIMSATEAGVAGSSEGAFMKEGTVYDYYSSGDAGLRIKSTIDGNPINI
ncbi:MAG: DUF6273 domain-containing protein [Mycoplasmoidaceae bacterium]|nr:DUF6273 domain-containing protein [Mycoplasmoidaceae bacterium]